MAKRGVYEFEFIEGEKAGQKKEYQRKKISIRKMGELEDVRADYAVMISELNAKESVAGTVLTKEERKKPFNLLIDIYAKCALYYFGIDRETFENLDFDSTKVNIDAATNVSIAGRPNLAQP